MNVIESLFIIIIIIFIIGITKEDDFGIVTNHNVTENTRPGYTTGISTFISNSVPCHQCRMKYDFVADGKEHFCVDEKSGMVKLIKPVDREKKANFIIKQEASFPNGKVLDKHRLQVVVTDVNDNPPELNYSHPIFVRHNTSSNSSVAFKFQLFDRDNQTSSTGTLQAQFVNSNYEKTFSISCEPDRGSRIINAQRCTVEWKMPINQLQVDQVLHMPIEVFEGSKSKPISIHNITVHVLPEKGMGNTSTTIHVYCIQNDTSTDVKIGKVHVIGVDKAGEPYNYVKLYRSQRPEFSVRHDDGQMTINLLVAGNETYTSNVQVTVSNKHGQEATSNITVHVVRLSEKSLRNPGSIRIRNISSDDFIRIGSNGKSRYDVLRLFLSEIFNVKKSEVAIFSIISENRFPAVIQVYFTIIGHKSPSSTYFNAIVTLNKRNLNETLWHYGAEVLQIGVNDCVFEGCQGGCQHSIQFDNSRVIVNAQERILAGMVMNVTTQNDRCADRNWTHSCSPNPCLNRGLCHVTDTGPFCECRDNNGTGPRSRAVGPQCQGRMRRFDGKSYIWLHPIQPCKTLRIQFHFLTESATAFLLFNGPMAQQDKENIYETSDYFSVYVVHEKVKVQLDLGDGPKELISNEIVNPSVWHKVEIILHEGRLTLLVDDKPSQDQSHTISVLGYHSMSQLNLNTPLQVGGVAKPNEIENYQVIIDHVLGLNGWIRDLYINGIMQDLKYPLYSATTSDTRAGLTRNNRTLCCSTNRCEYGVCANGTNTLDTRINCICNCDIGYAGENCDKNITWYQFKKNSYIRYNLNDISESPSTDIQMIIATKMNNGALFSALGKDGNIKIKLSNGHLAYYGSNGSKADSLTLSAKTLTDFNPHHVHLTRGPSLLTLSVDSKFPPIRNWSHKQNQYFQLASDQFYVGANGNEDFQGCIGFIQYNNQIFPLGQNDTRNKTVRITNISNVHPDCPDIPTCATIDLQCPPNFICQDFWKGPFCTCAPGKEPKFDTNDVWITCGDPAAFEPTLGITLLAIILIIIFAFLVLLIILLIVFLRRRRRPYSALPTDVHGNRQGISSDDRQGAGEEDTDKFDRNRLLVPLSKSKRASSNFDKTDQHRYFLQESPAGSTGKLSTLTSDDDNATVDTSEIRSWGPKFANLRAARR